MFDLASLTWIDILPFIAIGFTAQLVDGEKPVGVLSVRDVLSMIHAIEGPITGADIVELNPSQDLGGVTASVAAKITREIAGGILLQR